MVTDLQVLVGKRLLFGIRYVDPDGQTVDRFQACGTVNAVDSEVVSIQLPDRAEPFTLPAEPDAYDAAAPGGYRLHADGETVIDPDFTSIWTVRAAD